ncbi:glycosyl hydrolase family 95 catalytic domain-containing protein [Pedobacter frigoris]|uniref:glycoside hydrolase family 95 protein n=1 Tax=Pedobacter frigoris TaxID=2571272 RepID=UPI002931408A|nr:glycoside hydrolase N-terminal domain-containing protein [Pedobacter frigoris]
MKRNASDLFKNSLLSYSMISCLLIMVGNYISSYAQNNKLAISNQTLWYTQPANHWLEALPMGNGALGAMIFSGTETERIQFNESTLATGTTETIGSYQPFGNIYLKWNHKNPSGYKRELTLNNAVQTVAYTSDGTYYHREYFISYPQKAMLMQVKASSKKINVEVLLKDVHQGKTAVTGNGLSFAGTLENKMQYEARLQLKAQGGTMSKTDSSIIVKDADVFTLYLVAGTSFKPFSGKEFLGEAPHHRLVMQMRAAVAKPYAIVKAEHEKDFGTLYNRVQLTLGQAPNKNTLARLKDYTEGKKDADFDALLFQYGRYLLISSSRKGGVPANLQGIWNDDVKPAWYAQYTTNINVQMNYWPAEITHLPECHYPMLDWVENLGNVNRGSKDSLLNTKKGWVAYSTNNIMGGPSRWRLHRPGSAWLVQHFWEHYCYTGDLNFLKQRAYPLLKELTEYWESFLVLNKDGKLISPDGWSPEHGPGKNEEDKKSYPGASYDQQIVYDLFSNFIDASKVLSTDAAYRTKIEGVRKKMLGPQIGRWGQLQEWMEDVDDSTDHHRHNSHLFAVYPGRQIAPLTTPEWAKGAIRSMDARGNGGTGWSVGWKINIWARLFDGNKAYDMIQQLIRFVPATETSGDKSGLYANLFDICPPFQIDGNFGYTAGVAEMLLQSHEGEIHVLPALPDAWQNGSISGLKARGNVEVTISWKNKKLTQASFKASKDGIYTVRYERQLMKIRLKAGTVKNINI